jgi:hypothetical protein
VCVYLSLPLISFLLSLCLSLSLSLIHTNIPHSLSPYLLLLLP